MTKQNKATHPSEQHCLFRQKKRPIAELIHCVVSPEKRLLPDLKEVFKDEGAWITCSKQVVEEAIDNGAFKKSLGPIKIEDNFASQIERLLKEECLATLKFANKSGNLVYGFEKVSALLKQDQKSAFICANEGKGDSKERLLYLAKVAFVDLFSHNELALVLGRSDIVYIAMKPGTLLKRFEYHVQRLEWYRGSLLK